MEEPTSLSDHDYSNKQGNGNQELLVMTVEIGDGRQDVIRIYEGDDPEQLARSFADKHGLDWTLQQNLAILIRQNKEMVEIRAGSSSPEAFKWTDYANAPPGSSQSPNEPESSSKVLRVATSYDKSKGNVFERLYKQGAKKPTVSNAQEHSKSRSASNINYGEWLYLKGMKMKETQKQKAEEEKKRQEVESTKDVHTFKPNINEYSNLLAPRYFERTEDLLLRKAGDYQEHKEHLKAKVLEEQMKECTFTPKILDKSQNVTRESALPKHEALYTEAEKRKQKLEYLSEMSFKMNQMEPTSMSRSRVTVESQEEYADKLIEGKKRFEEKMHRIRQEELQREREVQGKPTLLTEGHHTSTTDRHSGTDVFEHLYSRKDEKTAKITQTTEGIMAKLEEDKAKNRPSETSIKYLEKFRGKQYAKIFALMDSDLDGIISSDHIELEALDNKVLEVLTPIFSALDEGTTFEITAFVTLMEDIWNNLTVGQKGDFLRRGPRFQETVEEPFSINQNSAKLAEKRGYLGSDLYERSTNQKKLTSMKLEKEKEISKTHEMKDCTFKPNLAKGKTKAK